MTEKIRRSSSWK